MADTRCAPSRRSVCVGMSVCQVCVWNVYGYVFVFDVNVIIRMHHTPYLDAGACGMVVVCASPGALGRGRDQSVRGVWGR